MNERGRPNDTILDSLAAINDFDFTTLRADQPAYANRGLARGASLTAPSLLGPDWLEGLSLNNRRRHPELYLSSDQYGDGPHAAALRVALRDLGLAAVFCIESVPTVGFLVSGPDNPADVDHVHRVLWNQGLMTLLLVIEGDLLRAYSLARLPRRPDEDVTGEDRRLVRVFERVADALELKDLLLGVESGRWWSEHPTAFDPSERVDTILLDNMVAAAKELRRDLSSDAAQALLMQAMFIAYLEDREAILAADFEEATAGHAGSFKELLQLRKPALLEALFKRLSRDFNGRIFLAPCSFLDSDEPPPRVQPHHMEVLGRFREGRERMRDRQGSLWATYDFRYIPVALISAVYDHFLRDDAKARRATGAYYTPMFLADTVVDQVWEALTEDQRAGGWVIDPACGSGIFLVRIFQRMAERRRMRRRGRAPAWPELISLVERLHGMDTDPSAVRIATFSLCIALLEQVTPPYIRALRAKGRMLPELWGQTLRYCTFFGATPRAEYDIIIGNPPWASRRPETAEAVAWCERNDLPCPGGETAWAFVWKSGAILARDGVAGLLLPAMGILHNHSPGAIEARRRLLQRNRIERIINFSDLTFQLFDGADRPAALVLYRGAHADAAYYFDYWCPKADLNLKLKRTLVLSHADRARLRSDLVAKEPRTLKRRLWMRSPDEKLIQYLADLPKASDLVDEYGYLTKRRLPSRFGWIIGAGFQPVNPKRRGDPDYWTTTSNLVTELPYLDANTFTPIALPHIDNDGWIEATVRRAGFTKGFLGPHILVPKGIERADGRIRAAYTEQSIVFQDFSYAIAFPEAERRTAKLLVAVLNSSLSAWFVFHETANLGTDRALVHQTELLDVPFPLPRDLEQVDAAQATMDEIVMIMDEAIDKADDLLIAPMGPLLKRIDELVFRYFGLSEDETAIVEETLQYIVPAMQPSVGDCPALWRPAEKTDRASYANLLAKTLSAWFRAGITVDVNLAAIGRDLAVLRISLNDRGARSTDYDESGADRGLTRVLGRIWSSLPISLPGNFQAIPDVRVFLDGDLYVVKPRQMRHWLKSTALADSDGIAADLHKAAVLQRSRSKAPHVGG